MITYLKCFVCIFVMLWTFSCSTFSICTFSLVNCCSFYLWLYFYASNTSIHPRRFIIIIIIFFNWTPLRTSFPQIAYQTIFCLIWCNTRHFVFDLKIIIKGFLKLGFNFLWLIDWKCFYARYLTVSAFRKAWFARFARFQLAFFLLTAMFRQMCSGVL